MITSHQYYKTKCLEHLDRVMVSHACAFTSPNEELSSKLQGTNEEKRQQFVNDIHFVALKTNFELFLARSLRQVWLEHFDHIRIGDSEKVALAEVANLASVEDLRNFVVDQLVPRHGLQRLGKAIQEVTGVSLPSIAGRHWPQVAITFGIRHLIEHGNGRTDSRFFDQQSGNWNGSSFSRREIPSVGEKIEILCTDIQASDNAMREVVPRLSARLSEWTPR